MTAAQSLGPVVAARPAVPHARFPREVVLAAALVVVAAIAVVAGAPAVLRAPLSIAAAGVSLALLTRRLRRHGVLRALAGTIGGAVVALVLTGLVLNLLPSGLTAPAWGVAVALLELVVLAFAAAGGGAVAAARPAVRPRRVIAAAAWTLLVLGISTGAVVWSVASFDATHVRPVALAAVRQTGDRVEVTVTSGRDAGPYELDLVTAEGRTVVARDVRARAGSTTTVAVALPAGRRGLLQLIPAGATAPERELIVDAESAQ